MAPLGTTLTLLTGPTIAVPAPPAVVDCLERVEVTTSDTGRSGFQIVFADGRGGPADLLDYPLLRLPLLRPFHRVVLLVTFAGTPKVLMDGVITHREVTPGPTPGSTRFTVTGEDVSVLMDLEEKTVEHPAQDEAATATAIISSYATLGMVPDVVSPSSVDRPAPTERVPVQQGTDFAHLTAMARRFGFVFFVVPGPSPMTSRAYWGPPVRGGTPQRALSVDLGVESNVQQVTFRDDGMAPTQVVGEIQDRLTNKKVTVRSAGSTRAPLATRPDWSANLPNVRTTVFRDSGLSSTDALARAQGTADASTDSLTATGTLDALRYGDLLTARGLVGLRGAGLAHDGLYYVQRVTHTVACGEYSQAFTLTRDGTGSTVTAVAP